MEWSHSRKPFGHGSVVPPAGGAKRALRGCACSAKHCAMHVDWAGSGAKGGQRLEGCT
jgi:hypothetical protein